jgi:LEA14-like dessication related protein
MRTLRRLILLALFVGLAGFTALRWPAWREAYAPRAQVTGARVVSWSLAQVELALETEITNPTPLSATVSDVPCALTIGGIDMGTAHIPAGTTLTASGVTKLQIPMQTPTGQVAALIAQSLERGVMRPYQVRCTVLLDVFGHPLGVPFEKRGWVDLTRHELFREDRSPER